MTKEYNKNFIIQQSAKLFYYKGYKNTELTDIFKACEMPNDIFYKFFSSKEELLIAVIKYHTEKPFPFGFPMLSFYHVIHGLSHE